MREYEVIRISDNETVDIIYSYSQSDAYARSGYEPENYILIGRWYIYQ